MSKSCIVLFLALFAKVGSYVSFPHQSKISRFRNNWSYNVFQSVGGDLFETTEGVQVNIFDCLESLAIGICKDFVNEASDSINKKGSFYVAVPGGSVLKMLGYLKNMKDGVDWSKVFLFYVNHKCVPKDDSSSTHKKAVDYFIKDLGIPINHVATLSEDAWDHEVEAQLYQEKILNLVPLVNGVPNFDYILLGMGKDGHIGSLYPHRKEIEGQSVNKWVLPVDKKTPTSITLSLPVMNNSRIKRIVISGEDKSEAALCGISKLKGKSEFPACGMDGATWFLDKPCSAMIFSKLNVADIEAK